MGSAEQTGGHSSARVQAGSSTESPYTPIPYRLRIGVTGHRTLEHADALAARVSEVLATRIDPLFDKEIPHSPRLTPWVFTVMTSLAEGADRLVARVVLETSESEIEAILPFEAERYRETFASAESKREFDELCARATGERGITCVGAARSGFAADLADVRSDYLRAGHAVVDSCDVLVAIWDGEPARGKGGTADIVAHAESRGVPVVILAPGGDAIRIVNRGGGLKSAALRRMEEFNRLAPDAAFQKSEVEREYEILFGPGARGEIAEDTKQFIRRQMLPYFIRASRVAKKNKRAHTAAGLLAYVLSPLAVAAVAMSALDHSAALVGGWIELLLLGAILSVVSLADRNRVHKRWIEARYVTERLRTSILSVACGLAPSRTGVPPWLRQSGGEEAWAFRAADELARRAASPTPLTSATSRGAFLFLRDVWLEEQRKYHGRRSEEVGVISGWLERVGRWLFLAALAIAALHVGLTVWAPEESAQAFERCVSFAALILPAFGAAIGGIRTHRELSRLERRHQAMAGMVAQLQARCTTVEVLDDMHKIVRDTEDVMLDESGEWLAIMRFARIDAA